MARTKVQITIDDELLQRVDAYADEHYTSRSGVFASGAESLLLTDEVRVAISKIADAMQRIAMTGTLSDEDKLQLAAFQTLAAAMSGKV